MPPRPLRRMVGHRALIAALRTCHGAPHCPFQSDLYPATGHVQFHSVYFPRTLDSQEQPVMPMKFVLQFVHPRIFLSSSLLSAIIFPEEPNKILSLTGPRTSARFQVFHILIIPDTG
jgi:hypothetical protein